MCYAVNAKTKSNRNHLILTSMNFIFFSVHFPSFNEEFSYHLRQFGANVLGIGDVDFDSLSDRLKSSLTEYYRVNDLENYDEALRAVGYFTHKYGKIDRIESLNEYWLELEARIRTDFNIEGIRIDTVDNIRRKSRMKVFFEKGGLKAIPFLEKVNRREVADFANEHGFPIIVKPDKGAGAANTFKISDPEELDRFFESAPIGIEFIAEKFIDGTIYTYDGLVGRNGDILFESSTFYGMSVMDVVNDDRHAHYISVPEIDEDIKLAGRKAIKSFRIRERFFHLELFRLADSGEIIPLEINMRPPGAWITDSINFTHDMDIYREWANMVVNGTVSGPFVGKYYTAYASRKSHINYQHDHQAILETLNGRLVKHSPIESIFSRAMGNYAYQFRAESLEEVKQIIEFIQQENIG
jgi:hypothetical protein